MAFHGLSTYNWDDPPSSAEALPFGWLSNAIVPFAGPKNLG